MVASPSIATQQITWTYTHDLESAARFYGDRLELRQVLDQRTCQVYAVTDSAFLGVCGTRPGREVEPRGVVITIVTDDVGGWFARCEAANISTDGPPRTIDAFGVYAFFAQAPEGYRLEFQRFIGPAWVEAMSKLQGPNGA
jgi:predicted enzyme related to lactoylglutathione lyase